MKTNSKKWLKRLGIFLGTLILIVVGYVVYVFSSYYRLEDKQKLTITGKSTEKAKPKKVTASHLEISVSAHTVTTILSLWTVEKKAVPVPKMPSLKTSAAMQKL